MKSLITALALAALTLNAVAAEPAKAPPLAPNATSAALPAGHPPMPPSTTPGAKQPTGHPTAAPADMSKATAPLNRKAKVVSVLDAKQFTYMEINEGGKTQWLVSPAIAVKAGAAISYAEGEVMPKFHSNTLNRDFSNVIFTTRVAIDK